MLCSWLTMICRLYVHKARVRFLERLLNYDSLSRTLRLGCIRDGTDLDGEPRVVYVMLYEGRSRVKVLGYI